MSRPSVSGVVLLFSFIVLMFFPHALRAQTDSTLIPGGDRIEETRGRGLVIHSRPGVARVYIDGIDRGNTPLFLEDARAGSYDVRLEKDGYVTRRISVSVRSGSRMEISLELRAAMGRITLNIQSGPDSPSAELLPLIPEVFVDGHLYSSRTSAYQDHPYHAYAQQGLELPVGFRTIRVRAFGWEDYSVTLYIEEESNRELSVEMKAAALNIGSAGLSRRIINPLNPGTLGATTLYFEVSSPGLGYFTVFSPQNQAVYTQTLGPFETWYQSAVWNGRNATGEMLPDGIYTLVIRAISLHGDESPGIEKTLIREVEIDSAGVITPLALSSGKSGLLFSALPALLPKGSFQVEGSLMAGNFLNPLLALESTGAWNSLPFAFAFRVSPLNVLELCVSVNVLPFFQGEAYSAFSGGVKWLFPGSKAADLSLDAAMGLVIAWSDKLALSPFGMASGIELYFPFRLNFGRILSFTLSPAALWTGDNAFPWEPVPRLLVSGGLAMQLAYVSAGLSMRSEFNFYGGRGWPPFIMAGGEVRIFPPPSSFVFSLMGGLWTRESSGSGTFGGFFGLGIGIIY